MEGINYKKYQNDSLEAFNNGELVAVDVNDILFTDNIYLYYDGPLVAAVEYNGSLYFSTIFDFIDSTGYYSMYLIDDKNKLPEENQKPIYYFKDR